MPRGKDSYQTLPGYEKMTMTDHLKAMFTSDTLNTNPSTGAVENPRRELMKNMIEQRQQAEQEAKKKAGG